ncbi:MAG TPA: flagellar hook-associated protein FlgK [Tepidiformaceae bacterium]|nr:flagellar hook-associated protein FlgK [Tepidiformaceae bacterium]
MALSIGLNTATKALRAQQLVVDIASHNIANAQTPGFSRQTVDLRADGFPAGGATSHDGLLGKTGSGVNASDVQRIRDIFLDFQARQASGNQAQYDAYATNLAQAQVTFNDPSDSGTSALLSGFFGAWNDVVNDPESPTARVALVNATNTLTSNLNRSASDLATLRSNVNTQVVGLVDQINSKATQIASLNQQITMVEASGDKANDLRDQRDLLIDQLSTLGQVSSNEEPNGSVDVYFGAHQLVFGTASNQVQAVNDPAHAGMQKLRFVGDQEDVTSNTGQLAGLLSVRDTAIPAVQKNLDGLAAGLINSVNALHVQGTDQNGNPGQPFFTGTSAIDIGVNANITADPSLIAASKSGAVGDGANALAIANLESGAGMAIETAGTGLASGQALSGTANVAGVLPLSALPTGGYTIVANGANLELHNAAGAVVGTATPANIAANTTGVLTFMDASTPPAGVLSVAISAGSGGYTAASQLADLTAAPANSITLGAGPDAAYNSMISQLGSQVAQAQGFQSANSLLSQNIEAQRQSVSGVNIDEEVTNMTAAQHAYQAAAKVISTIDSMLDTLINNTGVG